MSHMKRWGAVWILFALFIGSWIGQFFTQLDEVTQTAKAHGEQFAWADFWPQFFAATWENWQSEFLQLLVQCLLVASLVGQKKFFNAEGSADKEDVQRILRTANPERVEAKVDQIREALGLDDRNDWGRERW